ncbi:putative Zn-finger protein [Microvirga flocculans]|uniref:Putative Zn-finger protein n=1 Tax=Microvirga flocculans TaxID=217168 RepID=A0A7W6IEG8_9HYPH|nr:zinc-finger domain-containing protein [Microvirga flocculans]MBB4039964.1 putative Zn-finger protein [Microvirga flocculans]
MADKGTPHFHNDPGVPVIHVGSKEFMCIGATPPLDHPHIFIDMGSDTETVCSYCSTLFKYDPSLKADEARPAECVWEPDFATDPSSR